MAIRAKKNSKTNFFSIAVQPDFFPRITVAPSHRRAHSVEVKLFHPKIMCDSFLQSLKI